MTRTPRNDDASPVGGGGRTRRAILKGIGATAGAVAVGGLGPGTVAAADATVHEADIEPVVDGWYGVAWDAAELLHLDNVIVGDGSYDGTADLDATARFLWDADYLYFFVEVTDETTVQDSGAVHDDDSIDLFLDVGNDDDSSYGTDEFMYQFRADGSGFHEVKNGATAGVQWGVRTDRADGYNVEGAIPWSTLGETPVAGAELGLDVHVNDDDNGGSRDSKLAWYATGPNVWDNPSNMGTVVYDSDAPDDPVDGPPSAGDWTLTFEDRFDQGSLDTDRWEVGFGWGTTSTNDDADVDPDRVWVDGDQDVLVLEVSHDAATGEVTQGAINSKAAGASHNPDVGLTRGPGTYFEARAKPIDREGVLPAFWAKPNNENWPPEIDFYEIFNYGNANDPEVAHFNTHYTTSGYCDDASSHAASGSYDHDAGENLSENWHVYGCAWKEDRVEFYFDGVHVTTESSDAVLASLTNDGCNPFYMMFTNHVNRVGTPDYSYSWSEQHHVDWVRVWDLG